MKKMDYVLVAVIMTVAIVSMCLLSSNKHNGSVCNVYVDGDLYGTYSLYDNINIDITKDDILSNRISIDNGNVVMDYANCPDKICVKQGTISATNETICCAPNGIVIVIEGDEARGEYDAITK